MRVVEIGRVQVREVAGRLERRHAGPVGGRLRRELVLDQVDDDRGEPARGPVLEIARDAVFAKLGDERPARVADNEEWPPVVALEAAMVGADAEREGGAWRGTLVGGACRDGGKCGCRNQQHARQSARRGAPCPPVVHGA